MMRKKLCVLATATAVSMAPIAVSGTLTATAFAEGGQPVAEATADKTDVLGRSTVSDKQIADEDGYFDSHDGEGVKIYYRKQLVENPRGNVVLAHGVSEHSGRYDYVAKRLLDAGYNVYRLDHRGHGKSASGSTPLGHIDNFQYILNDFDRVVDMAKGEHPDVKTFLLGHSMGALTVQAYGIREPGKVDGIITNGGGAPLNLSGKKATGETITPDEISEVQKQLDPTLFERLPLADITSFNANYAQNLIPHRTYIGAQSPEFTKKIMLSNPFTEGISTSQAVKDEYASSPLIAQKTSAGTALQLGAIATYDAVNADLFTAPTLIMHGTKDGIVPPYFSQDWYNSISSDDVEYINWEGQKHEVFNEPAADQALDTVVDWLDRHV